MSLEMSLPLGLCGELESLLGHQHQRVTAEFDTGLADVPRGTKSRHYWGAQNAFWHLIAFAPRLCPVSFR